jgi:spore germination cell wall hydrolase CwlJ-like protein
MLKISKAATLAALSVSILSLSLGADAGFAYSLDAESTALEGDTITVDPIVLAADAAQADATLVLPENTPEPANAKTAANGDISFTSGIGEGAEIALPARKPEVPEKADGITTSEASPKSAKSLAALVAMQNTKGTLDSQAHCLAGAVYFESKGETLAGQLAVAKVVMERAKSGRFASTLCGVVYQKSQFSFVRGGRMPAIDKAGRHWQNAVAISKIALANSWKSPVEGALYFHARYVSPGWRLARLGAVDNHIFYR